MNISRKRFLQTSALALAGSGLGVWTYTRKIEPHWVEVVERPMPLANLPSSLEGARVVQLSDIHIGKQVSDRFLKRVFDQVNGLEPEIVVYTGDFTSHHGAIVEQTKRVLEYAARGSLGSFGVLGNHDYGPNWAHPEIGQNIASAAEENGIRILRNDVEQLKGLQILGLDDLWAEQFDLRKGVAAVEPGRPAIALSHNPDTADHVGWGKFRGWILCGHTHGGQCKPPFLPPPLLPVKNRRYTAGTFQLSGDRTMYVNRGIGHLIRARFNVRPEVTVFHLQQERT